MTTTDSVRLQAPLVALRLHRVAAGAAPAPHVRELLGLDQREAQRRAALQALRELAHAARTAVDQLPARVTARVDEIAGIAVELGLAIARELVGDALGKGLVDPTATVVRCLRDCVHGTSRTDLVVRLHPADLGVVQSALQAMPELHDEIAAARFTADPAVPRGGVVAETDAGRLHYDPQDVLERVCAEVRREASP